MSRKHGVYLESYGLCVYWKGTPIAEVKSSKKGWAIMKGYENKELKKCKKR